MRHAARAPLATVVFHLQLILHHRNLLRRHGKPLFFDEMTERKKRRILRDRFTKLIAGKDFEVTVEGNVIRSKTKMQ